MSVPMEEDDDDDEHAEADSKRQDKDVDKAAAVGRMIMLEKKNVAGGDHDYSVNLME